MACFIVDEINKILINIFFIGNILPQKAFNYFRCRKKPVGKKPFKKM